MPRPTPRVRFAAQRWSRERGQVAAAELDAVRAAGYGDAEILEIVAHVALNTLTNYLNEVCGDRRRLPCRRAPRTRPSTQRGPHGRDAIERHRLHRVGEGDPDPQGSRRGYAAMEAKGGWKTEITPELAAFIAAQRSVFLATASADGQPYIQHRGGPPGFLRVLDAQTLGFADYPRQPPVHHPGQPRREPARLPVPDRLRAPPADQDLGPGAHRRGRSRARRRPDARGRTTRGPSRRCSSRSPPGTRTARSTSPSASRPRTWPVRSPSATPASPRSRREVAALRRRQRRRSLIAASSPAVEPLCRETPARARRAIRSCIKPR